MLAARASSLIGVNARVDLFTVHWNVCVPPLVVRVTAWSRNEFGALLDWVVMSIDVLSWIGAGNGRHCVDPWFNLALA